MNSLKRSKAGTPSRHAYAHSCDDSGNVSTDTDNDTNQDSPLLRLPPELRNRIYTLVLGVGHIHIRYRPYGSRCRKASSSASASTSTEPKPSAKSKGDGFYALALPADADPWERAFKKKVDRMDKSLSDASTAKTSLHPSTADNAASAHASTRRAGMGCGVNTALLLTCRQIHAEAALLPFSLNAWSFASSLVMERYLVRDRRLALAQRRAIRVLVVSDDLPSRRMERYLGGLRVVVWRNESTRTFEQWHLPAKPLALKNRNELLLYDS